MRYTVNKYPDGSQYVTIDQYSEYLDFRITNYNVLWTLNQIKDICDYNKKSLNIFIPSLIDAQADRRFNINESSGLKLVCKFINSLNFKTVSIFHPHNPEVVEALIDGVNIIDNSEFIRYTLKEIKSNNLMLLSTDAGGFKPLIKLADKLKWLGETFSASKSRKYEDGKSKLIQQVDKEDFKGSDILIVDDLCVNGGTFLGLAKLLKERNCGKLYLAVSHLTVEQPNSLLFSLFDKVFTTNSKGLTYTKQIKDYGVVPNNLNIFNIIS